MSCRFAVVVICFALSGCSGGSGARDVGAGADADVGADSAADADAGADADADADALTDADSAADLGLDFDAGPDADADADASGDSEADADAVEPPPVACEPGEACGSRLTVDGLCPGTCVLQDPELACLGTVAYGLCWPTPPGEVTPADGVLGGMRWHVDGHSEVSPAGEPVTLTLTATNDTGGSLSAFVALEVSPDWAVQATDFEGLAGITLPPGASKSLDVTLLPTRANVFEPWTWNILTVRVDGKGWSVPGIIGFGSADGPSCGGQHFPTSWCPDPACGTPIGGYYVSAACCDDVFYPGATCCTSADCFGIACVDGRCMAEAPNFSWANNAPTGHQRILLVLVDQPDLTTGDVCADRSETLGPAYQLEQVEAWFDEVSQARLGRDTLSLQWTVRAGLVTEDFYSGSSYFFNDYFDALEAHLDAQGCAPFADYDKVVVVSPVIDLLGSTAQAATGGRIGSHTASIPLLFAHELGHTYGASDLYLDLGARFRYRVDLMGDNLGGYGPPTDGVLRGEIGYMDLDQDGVVDLAQFADAPDALVVSEITATASKKGTIELHYRIEGRQGDTTGRLVIPAVTITAGQSAPVLHQDTRAKKVLVIDPTAAPGESLTIRLEATYRYSDATFTPRVLTLDETVSVTVQ